MPLFTAIGTAVAVGLGATAVAGTVAATGAAVAGGLALTTAGTFIAGATAFGLQMAAGIGLNMLAQQIAGAPASIATPTSGPGYGIMGRLSSGADQPRSFHLGWRATAGSLVYANTWKLNNNQTTPNPYLTQVIAISDIPLKRGGGDASLHIHALKRLWVNGAIASIGLEDEDATLGYPVEDFTRGAKDYLWIKFYDGTQTTADSLLVDHVANEDRPYTSTRVGKGMAYAILTAKVNNEAWAGKFPEFKFEVYGIPLYDISKDTTAGGSGSQVWSDPSTWGGDGDDLPAVQLYNVLRGISYDGDWLYGLQGVSAARLPAAHWIAQIEKCRASVNDDTNSPPTTGATYRSSAEVFVNNDIASTVEALLTACQGRLSETGGTYKLYCGAPDEPVMSFTDDDILSTEEQSFTPFFGLSDTITGITAKYPSPDDGWNTQTATPIYRTDLEALAGNRRLLADVSLDTVPYPRQVQQLMQESLQEAQRARRHTISLPPKYWPLEPGDIVEWTSERNGYEAKSFRVDGVVDKANLDVLVDLTEVDDTDYDWDTASDYTPPVFSPGDPGFVDVDDQAVLDFTVYGATVTDDSGAVQRPVIVGEWSTDDLDDTAAIQIQVRKPADVDENVLDNQFDHTIGRAIIQAAAILPATDYEARARYVPISVRDTEWTTWMPVTTPDTRFTFADLDAATRNYLKEFLLAEFETVKTQMQTLAANVAEVRNDQYAQKRQERNLLQLVEGELAASIEQVETVIIGEGGALAQLETELAATYATQANLSTLSDTLTAFAGPGGTFAEYVLEAESTFATQTELGEVETVASEALDSITTFAGPGGTFAQYQTYLTSTAFPASQAAAQSATLSIVAGTYATTSTVNTLDGEVEDLRDFANAEYSVSLDVNGVVSGFRLFNNSLITSIKFNVDYFQIASTSGPASGNYPVFEVGTVNGAQAVKFRGNMYGDGDIVARNIAANTITADKVKVNGTAGNLIQNGDFEVSSLTGTWVNSGSGSISLGSGATNSRSGNGHLLVSKPSDGSSTVATAISDQFFPVEPSRTYEVVAYAKGSANSAGGFRVNVTWYTSAQSSVSTTTAVSSGAVSNSAFTKHSAQVASPSNAAYAKISIVNNGSSSSSRHMYVDDVSMKLAISSTTIEDGAIVTAKILADQIETNHLKSEAATALFSVTGENIDTGATYASFAASPMTNAGTPHTLCTLVVNIVNGECLVTFDCDMTANRNNGANGDYVDLKLYRSGSGTALLERRYWATVTNNDSRVRYPCSFSRVVNLPVGSNTLTVQISTDSFANNQSTLRGPTLCVFESRR